MKLAASLWMVDVRILWVPTMNIAYTTSVMLAAFYGFVGPSPTSRTAPGLYIHPSNKWLFFVLSFSLSAPFLCRMISNAVGGIHAPAIGPFVGVSGGRVGLM